MPLEPAPSNPSSSKRSRRSLALRVWAFLVGCLGLVVLAGVVLVIISWFVGDTSLWWQMISWVPAIAVVPVLGGSLFLAVVVGGWFGSLLRSTLLLGLLFMVSWVCGVDYGLFRARQPQATDGTLVHWNSGSLWGIKSTVDVVEDMIGLDPDLLVVTNPGSKLWTKSTQDYHRSWKYVARNHGALVMSRFPIRECRVILAAKGVQVVKIVAQIHDDWWDIWAVDLPSRPELVRSEVFDDLRRRLDLLELDPPDIILGDFNVPRNSRSLHKAFPEMKNAFDQVGVGWHATWPSGFPLWQLDQVLLGPRVEGVRYQIFPSRFGAHRIQQAIIRPAERSLAPVEVSQP